MRIHCLFDELKDPFSLRSHPKNRNKHPSDQITQLANLIEYQGWRYAVKISKLSGYVTSGHGRIQAAIEKGWNQVPVVYQDYDSEEQEYADVQADNAIASWAELDLASINLDVPDLGPDFDIDLLGIKDFVIEPADKYADQDADAVPETRNTKIKRGDLFQMGNHRLLCGDATSKEDVERLMNGEKADMVYTDPPYGMNLDTDYSKISGSSKALIQGGGRRYRPVIGDGENYDPSPILQLGCDEIFMWGADYYHHKLPHEGSWIVWDKRGSEAADKMIGASFELCWSKKVHKKEIARVNWIGAFGDPEARQRVHPTQKPTKLHEWFFERWGKDKTNIVDLYLGSGSTLIACEKTKRKCFGMEIDPQYCQVIVDRWEKFTGQKAVKLD